MTHPHHPPDCRRRCHRRRIRRHLRRPQAAQRTRPHHGRLSTRQAASAAPGTGTATRARCRTPRATSTATPSTATCCRTAPGRAPTSPSPRSSSTSNGVVDRFDLRHHIRFGTAVDVRHLLRRRGSSGGHHRRRRRLSAPPPVINAARTALGHQLPEPARHGHVRGRDDPHRAPGPRARTSRAAASASSAPVPPASR